MTAVPVSRLPEDMLIEIMKKISGLDLEKTKQVNTKMLRVAEKNSKAIAAGPKRGLKVLIYVDRWQQDKIRLQQCRNYWPAFTTEDIELKMKALPISEFYLNFLETEEVTRMEELVELLNDVQPTCSNLDIKGFPTEYLTRIMNAVDCKEEISVHQKGGDDQPFLTTLNQSGFASKLNVHMENKDRTQIPELFSQIKDFRSFDGKYCSVQAFQDFIFDLHQATDYGNLKDVLLHMDFNNHANAYENPNLPTFEILWDVSQLPQDRRQQHHNPAFIRKLETSSKYVLISDTNYYQHQFAIVEKKNSNVLEFIRSQLKLEIMSEKDCEDYCDEATTKERRAEIIREVFLAQPKKKEN